MSNNFGFVPDYDGAPGANQGMLRGKHPRRPRFKRPSRSEIGVCTKYTLFFENCILFLIGLGFMALGTYILVLKEKTVHDAIEFFMDPACDMCLGGAIIFFLSFCGCMGALRENTIFLKIFYYSLCLFLVLEIGGAILFFLMYYVKDVRDALFPSGTFQKAIVGYRDDRDMQDLIDSMQSNLLCCGLSDSDTGYKDWNANMYFNCSEANQSPERCSVPPSCCKMETGFTINLLCGGKVMEDGSDLSNIYTRGCLKGLGDWVNDNSLIVGGVLLAILLPQIFIICLSRNLLDMIRMQKSKW